MLNDRWSDFADRCRDDLKNVVDLEWMRKAEDQVLCRKLREVNVQLWATIGWLIWNKFNLTNKFLSCGSCYPRIFIGKFEWMYVNKYIREYADNHWLDWTT